MSWYSEQDYPSHTSCAHPHTLFLADKTLTALVQWCFRAGIGAVKDHKVNISLTAQWLGGNKVEDAGATALAQAVKATVLMCELYLFQGICFLLPQMSRYTVVLAVGVVSLLFNLCVLLLCFFFCLEGKHSLVRKFLKVGVPRFQNRLDQKSLSPLALAPQQCAITARLQDRGGVFRITTVM